MIIMKITIRFKIQQKNNVKHSSKILEHDDFLQELQQGSEEGSQLQGAEGQIMLQKQLQS